MAPQASQRQRRVSAGQQNQMAASGEMFDKIGRIRSVRDQRAPSVELVVDGGVDAGNARELRSLGTDVLVAGTAVFHTTDRRRAIAELRGEEAR